MRLDPEQGYLNLQNSKYVSSRPFWERTYEDKLHIRVRPMGNLIICYPGCAVVTENGYVIMVDMNTEIQAGNHKSILHPQIVHRKVQFGCQENIRN
uniref:Uncharacterized protein n=1 Tax=Nelumbo nucifera TaxID=4432 RepID=A0A823A3X6_NELNU|nr:TPA_asm: hypothetical protein HUJ06_018605 [Nelumbo nucifera]